MSVSGKHDVELFKQKLIQQIKNKGSDLYYLLRMPHCPKMLKQNVLLEHTEFNLHICLNLIPVHDVYQINFNEGPVDFDFYGSSNTYDLMGNPIKDVHCEEVEITKNLITFRLKRYQIVNNEPVITAMLVDSTSIGYNFGTGEWAMNRKEYGTVLEFLNALEIIRRLNPETYLQYITTQESYTNIVNSGHVNGYSIRHQRFMNTMQNSIEYPSKMWAFWDIIQSLYENK